MITKILDFRTHLQALYAFDLFHWILRELSTILYSRFFCWFGRFLSIAGLWRQISEKTAPILLF